MKGFRFVRAMVHCAGIVAWMVFLVTVHLIYCGVNGFRRSFALFRIDPGLVPYLLRLKHIKRRLDDASDGFYFNRIRCGEIREALAVEKLRGIRLGISWWRLWVLGV